MGVILRPSQRARLAAILVQAVQQRGATLARLAQVSSNPLSARVSGQSLPCKRRSHCGANTPHLSVTLSSVVSTMELVTVADRSGPSRQQAAMVLQGAKQRMFNSDFGIDLALPAELFRFSR